MFIIGQLKHYARKIAQRLYELISVFLAFLRFSRFLRPNFLSFYSLFACNSVVAPQRGVTNAVRGRRSGVRGAAGISLFNTNATILNV